MKQWMVCILTAFLVLLHTGLVEAEDVSSQKQGATARYWPEIVLPLGAWGVVSAGMFVIDRIRTKLHQRDSIITFSEAVYKKSLKFYADEKYDSAATGFTLLLSEYRNHSDYLSKAWRQKKIVYDSIKTLFDNSKLLETLTPDISQIRSRTDSLPNTDYAVLNENRHELSAKIALIKKSINSHITVHRNYASVIEFGFRNSLEKVNLVDSLIGVIYEQQKNTFKFKCKFFYNRAIESGDTLQLKNFVDDCDYFQVDKEWCTRARMAFQAPQQTPVVGITNKQMTLADSITMAYQQVINSGRIDLLEGYISKYSKKRYSKYFSMLDSVKSALNYIKKQIEAEKTYNHSHPLFANGEPGALQTFFKGLAAGIEQHFETAVRETGEQLKGISGLRFPASVAVDYTRTPPIMILNGYVHCPNDIEIKKSDSCITYSIQGITQAVEFLDGLKCKVANRIRLTDSLQAEQIDKAVYIVRLRKSPEEYVTFYAKGKSGNAAKERGGISFFEFFDFTVKNYQDVRFKAGNLPLIIVTTSGDDSLKMALGKQFFEQ